MNYTLLDLAKKKHLTYDEIVVNFPLSTYDISEAQDSGLFMFNFYDAIRSWRVKTDTYQIDPEHINLKSIVAAYVPFDYELALSAPIEDGGVIPITVDPTKVWVTKEEDGTTDYFFLIQDVPFYCVTDDSTLENYAEDESIEDNSLITKAHYPGMMCVRVNPNYDWVHCISHIGFNRFNGSDYDTPYLFDNSNYILRTTAKFTPFDKIEEGKIWDGCNPDPIVVGQFTDTGH